MRVKNENDVHNIEMDIEENEKISDKLIGFGPFGIGLDGILTWIPGVGDFYSLAAGAYLLTQGIKARVSGIVLIQMIALIMMDLGIGIVPLVGNVPDMLFCAHLWAGLLLRRAIRKTLYVKPSEANDTAKLDQARRENMRIIFLPADE